MDLLEIPCEDKEGDGDVAAPITTSVFAEDVTIMTGSLLCLSVDVEIEASCSQPFNVDQLVLLTGLTASEKCLCVSVSITSIVGVTWAGLTASENDFSPVSVDGGSGRDSLVFVFISTPVELVNGTALEAAPFTTLSVDEYN
jgi:hypothetical protein